MSNTHKFFIEDGQGGITTEDGAEVMDYIIEEGEEFNLRKLTNLSEYNECQPVHIELDAEDEDLESRLSLVIEKANKTIADKIGSVRNYTSCTDDQKTLLLYYLKIKFFSAAKAAEYAGIAVYTTTLIYHYSYFECIFDLF